MLKYFQVKNQLLELIATLEENAVLPSIRTLMSDNGFSQTTLVKALDELEKDGIIKRKRGSGIFVAPKRAWKKGDLVGVLLPYLGSSTSNRLLRGIQEVLFEEQRCMVLLPSGDTPDDLEKLYNLIRKNELVDLIINPSSSNLNNIDFIRFVQMLEGMGCNIVVVDIPIPGLKSKFVGEENVNAFTKAARMMVESGVLKMTVVGKFNSRIYSSRLKGIRNGLVYTGNKLRQIDLSDGESPREIARAIAAAPLDGLILTDARSTNILLYELRSLLGNSRLNEIKICGIVEADESLALTTEAIMLKKQSFELGTRAARMLRNDTAESEVTIISINVEKYDASL